MLYQSLKFKFLFQLKLQNAYSNEFCIYFVRYETFVEKYILSTNKKAELTLNTTESDYEVNKLSQTNYYLSNVLVLKKSIATFESVYIKINFIYFLGNDQNTSILSHCLHLEFFICRNHLVPVVLQHLLLPAQIHFGQS